MSKRIFTQEHIQILLQNPNVEGCSTKSIRYRKEFKLLAVRQYQQGVSPSEIFRQAQFDVQMIGPEVPDDCLLRWRRIFKERGEEGLRVDGRAKSKTGGRPKTTWQNDQEKIEYLEARIAYLKAENDFLAKLRNGR